MTSEGERQVRAKMTVSDHEGIYPVYGAFYVHAILYAAGRADASFARFGTALQADGSPAEIVASVHEALGHAAALSRFFFPADKGPLARARAAKLRRQFAVSNSSPLVDRALRNALEHFDERLDDYLLGDIVGHIFPGPIMGDAELADEPGGHIFRLVDPVKEIFVLLGQKHDFGAVRVEVQRIAELARRIAK
ncbi:hypothetical protein [Bosea sp. R86505]|uniref:hypothetical protein n=1 Tax=Bosea sp. R86505 TaxID=3101710 RepID=UPI003672CBC1